MFRARVRTLRRLRLRFAVICALTLACSADNSASARREEPARSDSAGIEIVQNRIRDSLSRSAWTVDNRPAVDIGTRDGAPESLLAKVAGALRLQDRRILVAETDGRLRYFDSTGKHDTTISRGGQGPGEVGRIARIVAYIGDSLLIVGGASGTHGRDGGVQNAKLVMESDADWYGLDSGNLGR